MAGVADKAQFYLEQAVPQLREFEDKEIFSKDEIRTLVRKRTDFEHRVLSPGSRAPDYLSYIEWEASLDSLRARRCSRLRIRHLAHGHASAARVTSLHERGLERDPGSLLLWRSYLAHLARTGASRRWRRAVGRALRLHPQEASLWTLAGRRAAENGDMDGARAYFLRGCRFCRGVGVWVEYARVEMEWLGRMEARGVKKGGGRKALSLARAETAVDEGDQIRFDDDKDDEDDEDGGVFGAAAGGEELVIPDPDRPGMKALVGPGLVDEDAVKKLEKSPALGGAIPRAIFDIVRKQTFFDASSAAAFFDMFAAFTKVESQAMLLQHVLDAMIESYPREPATWDCRVRRPLIGFDSSSAEYPRALRDALARLREGLETTENKTALEARTAAWIEPVLAREDLDEGIRTVLEYTRKKMQMP